MDILALLKEGKTKESIVDDFTNTLADALAEYEEYLKEIEEKKKAEAARQLELEFRKTRQSEARHDLGVAMINYFESLGMVITEQSYKDVDLIIDVLPQIRIMNDYCGGMWS